MKHVTLLRRLWVYFRPDSRLISLLLGLSGLQAVLGLAAVWPLAILVDTVLNQTASSERAATVVGSLLEDLSPPVIIGLLAFLVLLIRLLQESASVGQNFVRVRVAQNGMFRLQCGLFSRLQEFGLRYHRTRPQGDTMFRLTKDAEGLPQLLNTALDVVVACCTLVVMLALMGTRSLLLTAVAVAIVPLLLIVNVAYGRALERRSRSARQRESELTATIHRSLDTIELIQAFGRGREETRRFHDSLGSSLSAWLLFHREMCAYRIWVGLIFGLGAALIFGYGGQMAYEDQILGRNPDGMTVGNLLLFMSYLAMLYDPLCKISGAGASIAGAVSGMERVFEVMDLPVELEEPENPVPLPVAPRTLSLNGVSFGYVADSPILRNVSLEIPFGTMVAFVGPSGVGKSTILRLACRLLDPCTGSIQLDGRDLRDAALKDVRGHVAIVLQETAVLAGTVAENIAYGRPEATIDQIREAAQMAGISDFIEALPHGYDTVLAERGANLSGGQRQRIAIARALVTQAPILVLDEPTSALDGESEQRICHTLKQLKGRRTIIVVSHRPNAVVDCDKIYVMQEGRLTDRGSHAELLSRPGWFAHMFRSASSPEAGQPDPQLAMQ